MEVLLFTWVNGGLLRKIKAFASLHWGGRGAHSNWKNFSGGEEGEEEDWGLIRLDG